MQPAAGLTPAQTDLKARRFRLASPATATVLGALVLALNAIAVPLAGLTVLNTGSDLLNLTFAGAGVVVARRQPRNPIGWILLIFIFLALLGDDAGAYAVLAYTHGHQGLPLAPVAVLLAPLGTLAIPVLPLVILLFPDGPASVAALAVGALGLRRAHCLFCDDHLRPDDRCGRQS
jgi:hypothetical protein